LGYAFQVGAEIDHYEARLSSDPAGFKREELEHLRGTTSRFFWYRLAEVGLTVGGAGVAVAGALAKRDLITGIGIGVASVMLPFVVIDAVNDARAHRYVDAVASFQPAIAVQLGGADRPWGLALGGRF